MSIHSTFPYLQISAFFMLSCKDYEPTFLCAGEVFYTKQELLILLHQQEFLDPFHSLLKEKEIVLCICLLSGLEITSFKYSHIA